MSPSKQCVLIWRICLVLVYMVSHFESIATVAAGYRNQRNSQRYPLSGPAATASQGYVSVQYALPKSGVRYVNKKIYRYSEPIIRRVPSRRKPPGIRSSAPAAPIAAHRAIAVRPTRGRITSTRRSRVFKYQPNPGSYDPGTTRVVRRRKNFAKKVKLDSIRHTKGKITGNREPWRSYSLATLVRPSRYTPRTVFYRPSLLPRLSTTHSTLTTANRRKTIVLDEDDNSRSSPDHNARLTSRVHQDRSITLLDQTSDLSMGRNLDLSLKLANQPTSPALHNYRPTKPSTTAILRIHTTSMTEARRLINGIGAGFKVTLTRTTPKELALLQGNATDVDVEIPRHEALTSNIVMRDMTSGEIAEPDSSKQDATGVQLVKWWKGKHICAMESPGLFGLNDRILQKIRTVRKCREKRSRYICVESYGFGSRKPRKTTTYKCCSGFRLDKKRAACRAADILRRRSDLTDPALLTEVSSNELVTVGSATASNAESLTVFMPNDEVVVAALSAMNGTDVSDSRQVEDFLENHVIPNQMLMSTQMHHNQLLTAISGTPIRVNFYPSDLEDTMTVNCRKVSVRDVINENSVVYFIDDVITEVSGNLLKYLVERPEKFSTFLSILSGAGLESKLRSSKGNLTLFAPTNEAFLNLSLPNEQGCMDALARNHLIEDVLCTPAAELQRRVFSSRHGEELTLDRHGRESRVNDIEIVASDQMTGNGVVHVINSVLLPENLTSVLDVLSSESRLMDMIEMLQAARMKQGLATGSNFTLISPTKKAFQKLSRSTIMRMISDEEELRRILMYHVVSDTVTPHNLSTLDHLETFNVPNMIRVIHYKRRIRIMDKGRKRFVNKRSISLQCAKLLGTPKLKPCNGAVLVIDKVLFPPVGSLFSVLMYSKQSNFSILIEAIRRTGLQQALDGETPFTFFAPSNVAFERLPARVLRSLLRNKQGLMRVIRYHLVQNVHCSMSLLQRSARHVTQLGASLISCPKRKHILLGSRRKRLRARVVESDLEATNGIVHAIDNILLPRRFRLSA